MILIRPCKEEIDSYVGIDAPLIQTKSFSFKDEEWFKDHKDLVLLQILPKVRPPEKVWRAVAEAYLTEFILESSGEKKSFEQVICDGSSIVPDLAYEWGRIKDPWAMAHDLIFMLHRLGLVDAYGRNWGFHEANAAYRDGWYAQKMYSIGFLWWVGLELFGKIAWNKKFKNKPEPITSIIQK